MDDGKVILNGKVITNEEFEEKKKEVKKQKGVKIVEVSNNIYKTRLQG